jgi:hypothetical protein
VDITVGRRYREYPLPEGIQSLSGRARARAFSEGTWRTTGGAYSFPNEGGARARAGGGSGGIGMAFFGCGVGVKGRRRERDDA